MRAQHARTRLHARKSACSRAVHAHPHGRMHCWGLALSQRCAWPPCNAAAAADQGHQRGPVRLLHLPHRHDGEREVHGEPDGTLADNTMVVVVVVQQEAGQKMRAPARACERLLPSWAEFGMNTHPLASLRRHWDAHACTPASARTNHLHCGRVPQLGKMLANTLKYAFFDTDTMVEMTHDKRPVSDIFKEYGEDYFRWVLRACAWGKEHGGRRGPVCAHMMCKSRGDELRCTAPTHTQRWGLSKPLTTAAPPPTCSCCHRTCEGEVLKQLAPYKNLVVATGGGAVIRPLNWSYLHAGVHTCVVCVHRWSRTRLGAAGAWAVSPVHVPAAAAFFCCHSPSPHPRPSPWPAAQAWWCG